MMATSSSNSCKTEASVLEVTIFFTATSVPLNAALNTSPLAKNRNC